MDGTAFPSADQIATAIVSAAMLVGDDPTAVASGAAGCRSRHVAMAALLIAFPTARRAGLAECVGYPTPRAGQAAVITARKSAWWCEEHVDDVVGALVADEYGEQAA